MATLREKKRQLYKSATESQIKSSARNKEKESHERKQLFKLQICYLSKDVSTVSEVLCGTDRFLLNYALKYKWFFQYVVDNNLKFIVNVLRNASRYSRLRILHAINKYSRNEQQCDGLHRFVKESLGGDHACRLLPSCSKQYIENEIKEGHVMDLRCSQISFIYRKSPSAAKMYIEQFAKKNHDKILAEKENYLKRHEVDLSCTRMTPIAKFLKSIVRNDTWYVLGYYDTYTDIFPTNNRYNSCYCLTFGRKLTKMILDKEKDYVIDNSRKLEPMLHRATVKRKLNKNEFKQYFFYLLPEDPTSIKWDKLFKIANHIKEAERIEMLVDSYSRKYNKSVLEDEKFGSSPWPKCMEKSSRHDWALDKISELKNVNGLDELVWYKYCYPSVAIPKFIENFESLPHGYDSVPCENFICCVIDMYLFNADSEEVFDFLVEMILKLQLERQCTAGSDYLHEKMLVFDLEQHKWLKLEPILSDLGISDNSPGIKFSSICFLDDFIYRNVAYGEEIPDAVMTNLITVISHFYISYRECDLHIEQNLFINVAIKRFDLVMSKLNESESLTSCELLTIIRSTLVIIKSYAYKAILTKFVKSMIREYEINLSSHIASLRQEDIDGYLFWGRLRLLVIDHMLNLWNNQESYMAILNNKPEILTRENLLKCLEAEKTRSPQMRIFYDSLRCFHDDLHKDLLSELEDLFHTSTEIDIDVLDDCAYAIACLKPRDQFQAWFSELSKNGFNTHVEYVLKYLHRIRPVLHVDFLIKSMVKYPEYIPRAVLLSIYNMLPSRDCQKFIDNINVVYNNPKEFQYV